MHSFRAEGKTRGMTLMLAWTKGPVFGTETSWRANVTEAVKAPRRDWRVKGALRHDPYRRIDDALSDAGWLLELPFDWDGNEADGYSEHTMQRARELLEDLVFESWAQTGTQLRPPRISPADNGSIDLFWKGSDRNLLINVAVDDQPITYFGRTQSGDTIGGNITVTRRRPDIAAWLTEMA